MAVSSDYFLHGDEENPSMLYSQVKYNIKNPVIQDDFKRVKDLFEWNRYALGIMGVWLLRPSYVTFTFWIVYLIIHIMTELADLYHVFGNLELMILNLTETTLEAMIFVKMMVLRYSETLRKLMIQIIDGTDPREFDSHEEMRMYLKYNRIARSFFRLWFVMGISTSLVYHLKPLEFRIKSVLRNESMPFVLPYRTRLIFFDVDDSSTFWLVWLYQSPMIYLHAFHSVSIGYLFSIVLHVCGKLSALAFRVQSLEVGFNDDVRESRMIFRNIVETHCNIVRMAKRIESVFHLLLLEELFISTAILALSAYSVLVHTDVEDMGVFISFLVYGATVLLLIYGYCIAGEYLITESTNVYKAYYQCRWYDLSSAFKKQLIICMIGAKKPLHLTGGGFYIFSLAGFTSVLKTAMGYISMLRTIG